MTDTTETQQTLPPEVSSAAQAAQEYRQRRIAHWDKVAAEPRRRRLSGGYHRRLREVFRYLVPPGQSVLELGCGQGDLLAALEPSEGVGVDFSPAMVEKARQRHPELSFVQGDIHELDLGRTFDTIILSDLVNDLWDVQAVLQRVRAHCTPSTRVVLNIYSRLWQGPLNLARRLGLLKPQLEQNWLTVEDLANLMRLADIEVVSRRTEVVMPFRIPLLARFCNRYLSKLWPWKHLAVSNMLMARPIAPQPAADDVVTSVIVAARNEEGHIEEIVRRTPEIGAGTELIFVEGGSSDNTWGKIQEVIAANPQRNIRAMQQTGKGKGDAVRCGFAAATGGVLMILDADMTVPPEDLPRFYEAWRTNKAEFVNGVRLIYPMEKRAMRFCNLLGNKFFSLLFSWLIGQPIKDTLCGTKVLSKANYERLAANRSYFGDFDPFGDFDLLFGAARFHLRILDLPVRYRERRYGDTNISRWKHGVILLRMAMFAAGRIKFV